MPYLNFTLPSSHAFALCVEKPSTMDETGFRKQQRSQIKVEEDTVLHFLVTKPFTRLPNLHTFFTSDYLYLLCTSKEQKLMTWVEVHNRSTQWITLTTSSILKQTLIYIYIHTHTHTHTHTYDFWAGIRDPWPGSQLHKLFLSNSTQDFITDKFVHHFHNETEMKQKSCIFEILFIRDKRTLLHIINISALQSTYDYKITCTCL